MVNEWNKIERKTLCGVHDRKSMDWSLWWKKLEYINDLFQTEFEIPRLQSWSVQDLRSFRRSRRSAGDISGYWNLDYTFVCERRLRKVNHEPNLSNPEIQWRQKRVLSKQAYKELGGWYKITKVTNSNYKNRRRKRWAQSKAYLYRRLLRLKIEKIISSC